MNPAPFALVLVFAFVGLFSPSEAKAEVSSQCLVHLAGLRDGTTAAEDVRYHTRRGEFSPCSEREAAEADRGSTVFEESSRDESSWGRRDKFGFSCGLFGCG